MLANFGSYPLNEIVTGDARLLAPSIPDESVDLIFTDPVYENIQDYAWLAETAARILKPNSACLVWIATKQKDKVMKAMSEHLDYAWTLHLQSNAGFFPGRTGICVITECLWYEKGKSKTYQNIADWYRQGTGKLPDTWSGFEWSKAADVLSKWLCAFSQEDHIIYDPFTGTGSLPAVCKMQFRNFLASEINSERADTARLRLLQTQPPLGLGRGLTLPAPDGGDSAPSQALSTPDMFSAIEHEPTPAPRR